jgi:hypothetical protein
MEAARAPFMAIARVAPNHTIFGAVAKRAAMVAAVTCPTLNDNPDEASYSY